MEFEYILIHGRFSVLSTALKQNEDSGNIFLYICVGKQVPCSQRSSSVTVGVL